MEKRLGALTLAMAMVLGAIYAVERLDSPSRHVIAPVLHKAMRWRGPIGPSLIAHLSGGHGAPAWSTAAYLDPNHWALDLLGFASQLVFNTFHNTRLRNWEHSGDIEFATGAALAHNRAMIEFCSKDPRLLSTLYVPLADLDRAGALAQDAVVQDR